MERYAIVMAGGSGLRLWPLSRKNKPKQFLNAGSDKSMLVQTVERITEIIPADRCYIITNQLYQNMTTEILAGLISPSNIILEPCSKNTAACITYAALLLKIRYKNGILCCIPADGYVNNNNAYISAIKAACEKAEANKTLVVIGIKPTYPETGYGYIKTDFNKYDEKEGVLPVIQFQEKPSINTAREFVSSGEYLWNSGIFIGSMEVILNNIQDHLPIHFEKLSKVIAIRGNRNYASALYQAYQDIDAISIDQGVLEKCNNILIIYGTFGWNDIGSLDALGKTMDTDSRGNAVKGAHIGIATNNCVIYGNKNLIATVGLQNMIVVDTGDVLLVCPKEKAQDIKYLTELLHNSGYKKYL